MKEKSRRLLEKNWEYSIRNVWSNADSILKQAKFNIKVEIPKAKTFASLGYSTNPKSIGDTAYVFNKEMNLRINPAFFKLHKEKQLRILKHEAIHIGIANHNKDFERIAREKGTFSSYQAVSTGRITYNVYEKVGNRYIQIRSFNDITNAKIFAQEQARLGKKIQLRY